MAVRRKVRDRGDGLLGFAADRESASPQPAVRARDETPDIGRMPDLIRAYLDALGEMKDRRREYREREMGERVERGEQPLAWPEFVAYLDSVGALDSARFALECVLRRLPGQRFDQDGIRFLWLVEGEDRGRLAIEGAGHEP